MAFDVARAKTVMFGGYHSPNMYAETWEYDGRTWLKRTPATSPPARYHASMVYDPVRHVTVLFGGTTNAAALGDMWTWSGTTWTAVLTTLPPPRSWAGLVWDEPREKIDLFRWPGRRDASERHLGMGRHQLDAHLRGDASCAAGLRPGLGRVARPRRLRGRLQRWRPDRHVGVRRRGLVAAERVADRATCPMGWQPGVRRGLSAGLVDRQHSRHVLTVDHLGVGHTQLVPGPCLAFS